MKPAKSVRGGADRAPQASEPGGRGRRRSRQPATAASSRSIRALAPIGLGRKSAGAGLHRGDGEMDRAGGAGGDDGGAARPRSAMRARSPTVSMSTSMIEPGMRPAAASASPRSAKPCGRNRPPERSAIRLERTRRCEGSPSRMTTSTRRLAFAAGIHDRATPLPVRPADGTGAREFRPNRVNEAFPPSRWQGAWNGRSCQAPPRACTSATDHRSAAERGRQTCRTERVGGAAAGDDPRLRAERDVDLRRTVRAHPGLPYRSEPPFEDVMAADYGRPQAFKVPRDSDRFGSAASRGLSFPLRRDAGRSARHALLLDRPPSARRDRLAPRRHRARTGAITRGRRTGGTGSTGRWSRNARTTGPSSTPPATHRSGTWRRW